MRARSAAALVSSILLIACSGSAGNSTTTGSGAGSTATAAGTGGATSTGGPSTSTAVTTSTGTGSMGCGAYAGDATFTCAPDGNGRGKCVNAALVYEACPRGCLREQPAQEDVCMGTTNTWSCTGSYGKAKVEDGDYYATEFGCWNDTNGIHTDPGDNCIPSCLSKAQTAGLCTGLDGPTCEETVNWYAADGARFGCLARLRVTNPANGKAAIVVALDFGPACSVENSVQHAILDMSGPANNYLFGGAQGASEKSLVHVVEVDPTTPLGPVP